MIDCFASQCDYCRSASSQDKDGYGRRFTTPRSMAVIQATTATTLNPSPDRKEAVGKKHEMEREIVRTIARARLAG